MNPEVKTQTADAVFCKIRAADHPHHDTCGVHIRAAGAAVSGRQIHYETKQEKTGGECITHLRCSDSLRSLLSNFPSQLKLGEIRNAPAVLRLTTFPAVAFSVFRPQGAGRHV